MVKNSKKKKKNTLREKDRDELFTLGVEWLWRMGYSLGKGIGNQRRA